MKSKLIQLWDAVMSPPDANRLRLRELALSRIELMQSEALREQALANAEAYAAQCDMLAARIQRLEKLL